MCAYCKSQPANWELPFVAAALTTEHYLFPLACPWRERAPLVLRYEIVSHASRAAHDLTHPVCVAIGSNVDAPTDGVFVWLWWFENFVLQVSSLHLCKHRANGAKLATWAAQVACCFYFRNSSFHCFYFGVLFDVAQVVGVCCVFRMMRAGPRAGQIT